MQESDEQRINKVKHPAIRNKDNFQHLLADVLPYFVTGIYKLFSEQYLSRILRIRK